MPSTRQTSFAAGELSPYMYGRTDLELHAHGARTLQNFFVNQQGAAVSRPGTKYISTCKTNDVVLVSFVYSDTYSFVLEFGAFYMRVHAATGYTGTEVTTTYKAEHLRELQMAQMGGTIVVTHALYPPKEIRSPSAMTGGAWVFADARVVMTVVEDQTTQHPTPIAPWFQQQGLSGVEATEDPPLLVDNPPTTLFTGDAAHPSREWRYMVSTLVQNNVTGEMAETYAVPITDCFDGSTQGTVSGIRSNGFIVLFPDRGVTIRHMPISWATDMALGPNGQPHANWSFVGVVYYRGRGNLYGLIGTTYNIQDFFDDGAEPNYLVQPRYAYASPWAAAAGTHLVHVGQGSTTNPDLAAGAEWPSAIAFFQQRRVFGGSLIRPSTIWASATDDFSNFQEPVLNWPGQPLEFSIYASKRERIRSMVPHRRLLVLTDSSVWSIAGAGTLPLDFDSVDTRVEAEVGADYLSPILIDGGVMYVRAKGRGVQTLTLSDGGAYVASDVSRHAAHLFVGEGAGQFSRKIVAWASQEDPYAVTWVVREDGVLLSLTKTGQASWAWARHTTGASAVDARFVGVCCVPEGTEDGVYLAVRRGGSTFIERMSSRITTETVEDSSNVDSAVRYEGVPTDTFGGLSRLEGQNVWVVSRGYPPVGPLRVVGGQVVTPDVLPGNYQAPGQQDLETLVAYIGLPFVCDLELLDAAPGRTNQKTVVSVGFEVDHAQGLEVGEDFSHLVPWRQREVTDSYEFPSAATAFVVVAAKGAWRRTGRAVLRQAKPLPVTVVGITRELDGGGV